MWAAKGEQVNRQSLSVCITTVKEKCLLVKKVKASPNPSLQKWRLIVKKYIFATKIYFIYKYKYIYKYIESTS